MVTDHPAFSAAAMDAISRWQYRPGVKDGKPVTTRMQIDVPFRMRR